VTGTVSSPANRASIMLISMIEARFAGEETVPVTNYVHPPELIVREST